MRPNEELAAALKRLGMTQEDLADKIGCTRQAVGLWVKGERHPRRVWCRKIERALKIRFLGSKKERKAR